MSTHLKLDADLVAELMAFAPAKSKSAAVAQAVKEHIRRAKLQKLVSLFGKIPFDETPSQMAQAADKAREQFLNDLGKPMP